ncbi:MAG: DNA replication/repair protein RecF, partial [Lachnospiraceae bacterium]
AERRRFIDLELSQIDKIYLSNLVNYNKVVVQRNKLLKDISLNLQSEETLDIWDMQLVKYGRELISRRRIFIEELNEIVKIINKNLTGGKELLKLEYEPDVTEDNFEKVLAADRYRDLKLKSTGHGPHKDDIIFWIDGKDGRKFGSQGQQRTCALSLKLAEIELVKKKTSDTPILLLDDVLSELDSGRQNFLLDSIGEIQTIITCTGLDEFIKNRFQINQIYKVVQGTVTPVIEPEQLGRE